MKKILVAFDGSEHALRALEEANKIKKGFPNCRITVLEVVGVDTVKGQVLDLSKTYEDRKKDRIHRVQQQLMNASLKDFDIKVLIGDPALELINEVSQKDYDLLIIGSRGLNGLQEFVMGSVSHKVVKHSAVPVMVVK